MILASQSPRRRELLTAAGYAFEVIVPHESVEAGGPGEERTEDYVARLADAKATDVANQIASHPEPSVVIACDTVADCDGLILEKPRDREHAEEMLRLLSGRAHRVVSGLCVRLHPSGKNETRTAVSELTMQPLSDAMLQGYLDSGAWEGKSGAFGFQDDLPWLELTSGTAENVVGLPMDVLADMLRTLIRSDENNVS